MPPMRFIWQGLSEGFHFFFFKAWGSCFFLSERLRPHRRWLVQPSLSSYRCVTSQGQHHQTCAIVSADGAKPAPSNSRRNARSSKACGERGSARKFRSSSRESSGRLLLGGGAADEVLGAFMTRPSFSGVVWPVCRRHQSTPKPQASAVTGCFFLPPGVLGLMICARHFCRGGSWAGPAAGRITTPAQRRRPRGAPIGTATARRRSLSCHRVNQSWYCFQSASMIR
jgi:hypothetical protein